MRGKSNIHKEARIGVDLMGSDISPHVLLHAVLEYFQNETISLALLGTEEVFSNITPAKHISFILAKEVISMEDDPLSAIRLKKNSSLSLGIQMLQKKELDGFISLGNTGALIASATMSLSLLPGIDRPALLTLMPTKRKEMAVLDVGANITFKTEHLYQFALMGIAFQKSRGIANPVVGLLNIGAEEKKGTLELREAYQKLQTLNQNETPLFIGNIEGRDVFKGDIDVLVTDGFTGNIFLKTSEGTATFIFDELQEKIKQVPDSLSNVFSLLKQRLHYADYPGAILCGVDGIVIKCHGESTPQSLINSIKGASSLVQHSFLEKIKAEL